jgi:hypothetical protein
MKTRQYFDWIDHEGKRRTFLLLPVDADQCKQRMTELGWSVRKCFEDFTGRYDAKEVLLSIDYLDEATSI